MSESSAEIRIYKRLGDPFARVPNAMLADERLSWRSKGIAAYLLGKPADWRVQVADLVKKSKEGRDAVYAAMNELRSVGYMGRRSVRRADGTIERTDYLLSDFPAFKDDQPLPEIPDLVKPDPAVPDLEKPDVSKKDGSQKEGTETEKETQGKKSGEGAEAAGPGYDIDPDEVPPPGLSIPQLRRLLFPLFNMKPHHHPSRLEMDAEADADGKLDDGDAPSLVRFYKLPPDSKVQGANTRKKTYRSLLENLGEQAALATRAFPPPRRAAASVPTAAPKPAPVERSPEEKQRSHELTHRAKVRAGLVPGISPERADDPALEIPPIPKLR